MYSRRMLSLLFFRGVSRVCSCSVLFVAFFHPACPNLDAGYARINTDTNTRKVPATEMMLLHVGAGRSVGARVHVCVVSFLGVAPPGL